MPRLLGILLGGVPVQGQYELRVIISELFQNMIRPQRALNKFKQLITILRRHFYDFDKIRFDKVIDNLICMCNKKLRLEEKIRILTKIEDDLSEIFYKMLVKSKAVNNKKNKLLYNVALPITHKGFDKLKSVIKCCKRISEERRQFRTILDFKNFVANNLEIIHKFAFLNFTQV